MLFLTEIISTNNDQEIDQILIYERSLFNHF